MPPNEAISATDLRARLTEFINDWPLYSPFRVSFAKPGIFDVALPGTILRACDRCSGSPTWARKHPRLPNSDDSSQDVGLGSVIRYVCTHCLKKDLRIWVRQDVERATDTNGNVLVIASTWRKLGQWPPQHTEPSPELAGSLEAETLELYKKGLTSVNHGFGVGALAYFRRVVENATNTLLDLFAEKAAAEGDAGAAASIKELKDKKQMDNRLSVAADALPATLRPGGVNPLSVLYSHYSRGIHGLSENECLDVAKNLSMAMEYIFRNWRIQMDEAAKFKATIQAWTDPTKTPGKS